MTSHIASAVRRADQVFSEQVGDKSTLDCGVAFFDVEYPHSAQDNVLREVWVEQPDAMPTAWAQVEQFYADSLGVVDLRIKLRDIGPSVAEP